MTVLTNLYYTHAWVLLGFFFFFFFFSRLFYHKFEQTHKEHYEQQLSLKDREIHEKNKEIDQLKKELEKGEVCSLARWILNQDHSSLPLERQPSLQNSGLGLTQLASSTGPPHQQSLSTPVSAQFTACNCINN